MLAVVAADADAAACICKIQSLYVPFASVFLSLHHPLFFCVPFRPLTALPPFRARFCYVPLSLFCMLGFRSGLVVVSRPALPSAEAYRQEKEPKELPIPIFFSSRRREQRKRRPQPHGSGYHTKKLESKNEQTGSRRGLAGALVTECPYAFATIGTRAGWPACPPAMVLGTNGGVTD